MSLRDEATSKKGSTRKVANNIKNINTSLFSAEAPRFLIDERAATRILNGRARLAGVVPSTVKHGEGAYGYVTSAEVDTRIGDKVATEVAALKVSLSDVDLDEGIAGDVLRELSVYARMSNIQGLAKGLYAKLKAKEQRLVMEHYIMNLHALFKRRDPANTRPAENRPTELSGPPKMDVIRGVLFQLATSLKKLHDAGALHKDLKPPNMLLAHNGQILITDYGLTEYCVTGIKKPAAYYFNQTTPTIQPAEALRDGPIGPAYDIFSLGASFLYFLTRHYYIDFYAEQPDNNSAKKKLRERRWTAATTKADYDEKLKEIEADIGTWPKDITSLVYGMMATDPAKRMTIEEVLASPFLKGLSMTDAMRIVRKGLFEEGKPYDKRTTRILRNTTRKNTAGAAKNADIGAYFAIRPQPVMTRLPSKQPEKRNWHMIRIIGLGLEKNLPIYLIAHALELYDRIYTVRGSKRDAPIQNVVPFLCLNIAYKLRPFTDINDPDLFNMAYRITKALDKTKSITKEKILEEEVNMLADLNGDLFPQKGGATDTIIRALQQGSTAQKIKCAASLLLHYTLMSGETLKEWVNASMRVVEYKKDTTESDETDTPSAEVRKRLSIAHKDNYVIHVLLKPIDVSIFPFPAAVKEAKTIADKVFTNTFETGDLLNPDFIPVPDPAL